MTLEKTSGIKLYIGVDVFGLPHSIIVSTANLTDRQGTVDMADYYCDVTSNLSLVKKLLVDGGYTEQNFADEIRRISEAEAKVVKRNELHQFKVFPRGENIFIAVQNALNKLYSLYRAYALHNVGYVSFRLQRGIQSL